MLGARLQPVDRRTGRIRAAIVARAAILAVGSLALGPLDALAQTGLGRPQSTIPGATFEDVEALRERDARRPSLDGAETPESTQPGLRASSVSFLLSDIEYPVASTVYDDAELRKVFADRLGTEITVGELRQIADEIERLYRRDGYLATRVIIPPQTIADGIARLEIYEGRILFYEVSGEIGPVKQQIEALLDNLIVDEPARTAKLERYLLLARDLPGISLTGTLRSAGDNAPGGVVLVVDTARKDSDAFFQAQNKNAVPTGTFSFAGGYAVNSNTRYAERIGATGLVTHQIPEQLPGYLVYEQSLGNDGLVLRGEHTSSYSEPGDALEPLDLTTISTATSLEVEYPLVRSRDLSIWSSGGADVIDQTTHVGDSKLFDDQMRVAYAGVRGVWFHSVAGRLEFDVQARKGLDTFGASKTSNNRSRADAEFDYALLRGNVALTRPVHETLTLFGGLGFQWSDRPLPTYEELALGELSVGRGYEPGAITGDSGFTAIAEIRYAPPGLDIAWINGLEVYTFLDYGRTYDYNRPTGLRYEDLMSIGGGIRFQIFESLFGDVYVAVPQTEALSTRARVPNATVKFSLTQFF